MSLEFKNYSAEDALQSLQSINSTLEGFAITLDESSGCGMSKANMVCFLFMIYSQQQALLEQLASGLSIGKTVTHTMPEQRVN